MKNNIYTLTIIILCSIVNCSVAQERSNREIVSDIQAALNERDKVKFQEKLAVEIYRKELEHLTDAEKIRGMYQILLDQDKERKYHMSSLVGQRILWAKARDPHLITNFSELKKMIKMEQDPRKFYLLALLMTRTTAENQHNFIPEIAPMLFQDGPVLRDEGEYTTPYSRDVSLYAYTKIGWILKAYGRQITIPNELTHDQEVVILAKWLKQNWPGCGKLVIPEKFLKLEIPEVKEPVKSVKPKSTVQSSKKDTKEKVTSQDKNMKPSNKSKINEQEDSLKNSENNTQNSHVVLIVSGSLLIGALIMYFMKRKY